MSLPQTPLTIMCFTWNAAGSRLCETMSQKIADDNRKGFVAKIRGKKSCVVPDFFEDIRAKILLKNPHLIVITTQNEDSKDTYFHSDLLAKSLPELQYVKLKEKAQGNVGKKYEGTSGSSLRVSIYVKHEILSSFTIGEQQIKSILKSDGQYATTCKNNSGAIGSHVWHQTYGKFLFVSAHLKNVIELPPNADYNARRTINKSSNILCLTSIMTNFVDSLAKEYKPDHIIILGDLNYDINDPSQPQFANQVIQNLSTDGTAQKIRDLRQFDELTSAFSDYPLKNFKEGAAGEGVLFLPTWRLRRGRDMSKCTKNEPNEPIDKSCFDLDKKYPAIGWHDRIIYKEELTGTPNVSVMHCDEYNRLDIKNTSQSTHAGVVALFSVKFTP